ncbi:uncharacterized protein LOC117104024 [Anneissia japonica]|uniref:uncharacterized protein LOC117104024 n=1 Tax=Anneissia japonica TaxID=1529436 RepID=UPI001425B4E6|nr:uncharacterized protein LOC117104024 [Anneissia japonica]
MNSLLKDLEPMETEHSRGLGISKKLRDRSNTEEIYNVAKKAKVNGFESVAHGQVTAVAQSTTDLQVPSISRRVSPRSPKRNISSKSSTSVYVQTEDSEVLKTLGKEDNTGMIANEDITYIWDFPGQQLYYNHPICLKSEAVYLIEFNLVENMQGTKKKCRVSKMARETMTNEMTIIQIIKYQMEIIFTYAVQVEQLQLRTKKPKIVIVGTHNEVNNEEKMQQAEEQFKILFQEIKGTPYERYVVRKMYLIDNEKTLKQDICGFLKAMLNTIPLTWHKLQRLLQEMGRKAMHVHYNEVCKAATKCGILQENLIHALNYLHDLGIVMYFQQNRKLRDTVVINPWKVNNITEKLITAVKTDDRMVQLWNKLDKEGILEEELIRYILREELRRDEIGVFLELMKQVGFTCEQIKTQKNAHRSFYVPCRSKFSSEEMTITPDNDQTVSIYMTSDAFLFESTYHHIVVRLIEMVQAKCFSATPKLFYNKAIIDFGCDHTLRLGQVIIENKPSVKLEISRKPEMLEDACKPSDTGTGGPSPNVCIQVLEYLEKELKVLTSGMKHLSYIVRVLCWSDLQDHFHNLEECLKDDILCGEKILKTSKLQKLFKNMTYGNHIYLTDEYLLRISKDMGLEWKQLGVKLGLSWNRINQIWMYCCKRQPECTLEMLTEWRSLQKYETNQVKIMAKALKDEKRIDLANWLFASQCHVKPDECTIQPPHRTHYDGYLTDMDMLCIAKELNNDWKTLGIYLGMKQSELKRIETDFEPSVDASLEMLVRWRERQKANGNHLEKMSNALEELERFDIKDELQTYYHQVKHKCVKEQV